MNFRWLAGLFVIASKIYAQEVPSFFTHFDKPGGTIYAITQDTTGFMWFGASTGLWRFDGIAFTLYTHQAGDSTSLSDPFVREVIADQQGYLWINTLNGGLHRFNPATGTALPLKKAVAHQDFRKEERFSALSIDPEGNLWAAASQLYKINPRDLSITAYPINLSVNHIFFSAAGTMWLGTGGDGFGSFNTDTGKPDMILLSHPDAVIADRVNVIRHITEDRHGNLWLATYGGLVQYHPPTRSVRHWVHPQNDPNGLPHNSLWRVVADQDDKVWISSWGGGITFFDTRTQRFENNLFKAGNLFGLPAAEVPCLYRAPNGLWWAGTNGKGVYRLLYPQHYKPLPVNPYEVGAIKRVIQLPSYTCLITDTAGVFLLGTGPEKPVRLNYLASPGKLTLSGNRVNQVCQARNGMVYLGTENGLTVFNPNKKTITWHRQHQTRTGALNHNDVMALTADEDNRLWVGTPFGLSRMNDDQQTFTWYRKTGIPETSITALASAGPHLLIGTGLYGLFVMNKDNNQVIQVKAQSGNTPGLYGNYVTALCVENPHTAWIGTSNGLNQIQLTDTVYITAGYLQGMRTHYLVKTAEGLLAGTENGYYFLKSGEAAFRKIPPMESHGVAMVGVEHTTQVVARLPAAIYSLPLALQSAPPTAKPRLILTRFELAANSPNPLPATEAALHPAYRKTITLQHNQNFIAFEYMLLDYQLPALHQYAYRLYGFDNSWNNNGNRRFAAYTNIPPGTYLLQLRAQGADEVWYENNHALTLIILPPWWKTPWAYAAYALLIAALLWFAAKQIAQRERLKAEVVMAQREKAALEQLDHLKSQFFSNITHEFRTPLTLIQGPAHELLQHTRSENDRKLLEIILNNSQRLLHLIQQLLDLTRQSTLPLALKQDTISLSSWLRDLIDQFSSVAQNHRVALQWQLKEPLPDVTADEEKLKTIILNLLSNAIKFTPENGSVHVHAAWNNGMFTFEVTDTGCGIPPDELPLIFNRFYQARHTLVKATGGTGIGLSLVKMYTELMQGKILVKSTLNKGSTFSVSLPLPKAPTPAAQPQVTALPEPENHKEEAPPEKPLILLIDDADEVRLLLKTCLGSTYRYAEAANGKTGWEATLAYMPDMIISDLMMPVMDGLELCRKIKTDARTRHIPFLMLTAKAGDENKLSGLQGGADEYLVKPFSREELMARVHNLLQLREHIRRQVRSTMLTQATPVQAVSAEEQFVLTARRLVEENLTNPALSVEWLAEQLNLGREQCYRKMMAITGIPPSAFIRKIRLHRAAQLLAAKWGPVSQVAYEVGFENLSHFSKAFKEQFGKLPSEYNG